MNIYTHLYLILICIDENNIDGEMLQNDDIDTYGDKKANHFIWYHVKLIIDKFFKYGTVIVQAQILRGILTSKKLEEATTLLGIRKSMKDKKVKENVIQNINSSLKWIGRSRKKSNIDAHRAIQMAVVSSSTKENCFVKSMAKALGTSSNTFHKHRKFWLQIDLNDEVACWKVIYRQPYKDRLGEDVKKIIYEYWMKNSCVSRKARDVMRRRITWN